MRTEKDSLGTREIPDDVYYGIHSLRSTENFDVAGEKLPTDLVYEGQTLDLGDIAIETGPSIL